MITATESWFLVAKYKKECFPYFTSRILQDRKMDRLNLKIKRKLRKIFPYFRETQVCITYYWSNLLSSMAIFFRNISDKQCLDLTISWMIIIDFGERSFYGINRLEGNHSREWRRKWVWEKDACIQHLSTLWLLSYKNFLNVTIFYYKYDNLILFNPISQNIIY